jgi:hypothetical protein
VTAVAVLSAALATGARADGDPASDVLVSQRLFLPQAAAVSPTQQAQLTALLAAAGRDGYPVRVALIAGPGDLGSVTALWRQPQNYARFLGQELSLNYMGTLLVVMPNGYGLYRTRGLSDRAQTAVKTLTIPNRGLATGALIAVQRLAAASGHTLPATTATTTAIHGATDTMAWIVFTIGAILILMAWTASLRARPPRPSSRDISPTP